MSERNIRINKVLRELNISLERAVDFLKENGIIIESNPNFKINQKEYEILAYQFSFKKRMNEISNNSISSSIIGNLENIVVPQNISIKSKVKEIKNDKKLFTPGNVVKVKISKIVAPLYIFKLNWTFPKRVFC